jgi:hypothetical protein
MDRCRKAGTIHRLLQEFHPDKFYMTIFLPSVTRGTTRSSPAHAERDG